MTRPTSRRTVLTAALAAGAGVVAAAGPAGAAPSRTSSSQAASSLVDNRFWTTHTDWRCGSTAGTRAVPGRRPGLVISTPAGSADYTDPHTGTTTTWEYASWTSPVHRPAVPATEVIASWNAATPEGTWIQVELRGSYSDGTDTPWYVMGRWASDDTDIRRTSVDDQTDGKSTVWTDTFSVDDAASGLRLVAYRLRLTLHRTPGTRLTPTVHRVGAMASDVPDRFTVPASTPGAARELAVPRYSQNVHVGEYPEYDNGGEAWCSPTSSQMIIEYWGRTPTPEDLSWVKPGLADPQICHAARYTFDYQYEGCGNWPFNAAYAATYEDMNAAVTRLGSLTDLEQLVAAGIPVITSQSFFKGELTGAGYGTSGHLMTVIGFTADGDVIANDPASPSNDAVRRVYRRREWETIWLRTKRYDANGAVRGGTGGVCYVYWPVDPSARQRRVLRSLGLV
ncbi:peptidase C39 family protein [Streptomyces sp. NPDC012617]|uniref:Peptidase C39-like domain-containing protein n=1 Tax=Streptomyces pratensis (strain ATCC 33331 / IAF-45CD) TaxID=591167 RepID=A0A8D3WLD0_STRFA|nr:MULTISPECIES: peptidase C39 family protein [unclassified Streptomyces]MDF6061308.1 peptidase C39 family protein [Streptomyces sp. JH010]MYT54180.1 peptidase C39 family protein [Streptomyces sp. SID7815]MYT59059.1 peptidase C39 family protein [Streptomyces sp. SID7834]